MGIWSSRYWKHLLTTFPLSRASIPENEWCHDPCKIWISVIITGMDIKQNETKPSELLKCNAIMIFLSDLLHATDMEMAVRLGRLMMQ